MLFYICLGSGIIFIILFIIAVIIAIKEKDASFIPICFLAPFFGILLISGSFNTINRTGTVCEVVKVQTGYTETIINEEIKLVPFYSYQILFLDEDGKYRVFTTTDIHYAVFKEGDSITYTKRSTDIVK
jgi:hypothetical protein